MRLFLFSTLIIASLTIATASFAEAFRCPDFKWAVENVKSEKVTPTSSPWRLYSGRFPIQGEGGWTSNSIVNFPEGGGWINCTASGSITARLPTGTFCTLNGQPVIKGSVNIGYPLNSVFYCTK